MSNNNLSNSELDLKTARKQASDYAMAMDFLAKITHSVSGKEAIESILQLLDMLFMPGILFYVSLTNGAPDKVYSISKLAENEAKIKNRLEMFRGKYVWTESQKGFQVKIGFGDSDFGIIEVGNVGFPEHNEQYLNLTLSMANVCGLAIENARRHQVVKEVEKKLRQEKEKLEEALLEVKKLSGLLPICSFCKKIRDDKGYWNPVDTYIHEHSEATLSHSICQDCAKEHYPDMNLYDE